MATIARTCSDPVAHFILCILFCWYEILYWFTVVVVVVPVGALVLGWLGSFCVVGYVMLQFVGAWIWILTKMTGLPLATCTGVQVATASPVSVNDSGSYDTEASTTELSAISSSSTKSAAVASDDRGVLAEATAVFEGQETPVPTESACDSSAMLTEATAASDLSRQEQKEELASEPEVEEDEESDIAWDDDLQQPQQVVNTALQASAAGPTNETVPTLTGCTKFAASACDSWAMWTQQTAAFDLARKEQEAVLAAKPEVEDKAVHDEVAFDVDWEQQQQDKMDALSKRTAHRATPPMSAEVTEAVLLPAASDSAAEMLESQLQQIETALWMMDTDDGDQSLKEEALALESEVEDKAEHKDVAFDIDWEQQQQDKMDALSKQTAHRATPPMSAEVTEAVQAAGNDASASAAAELESKLQELETALWLMDKDDGNQWDKDTAGHMTFKDAADFAQEGLSVDQQWAKTPAGYLAMAEEMQGSDIQQPEAHKGEDEGTWGFGYAADGLELQPQEVQAPVESLMLMIDDDF